MQVALCEKHNATCIITSFFVEQCRAVQVFFLKPVHGRTDSLKVRNKIVEKFGIKQPKSSE